MTDFENAPRVEDPDNPYKHMTPRERTRFRSRLINHIATRVRHSFCCSVPMRDYREVNAAYYVEEWLGKPYTVAAMGVHQKLQAWKDQYAPNDPLEVFFEDGTKHKWDLRKVFEHYKVPEPIFKNKNKVVPLQAADLLAWENFNAFRTGIIRAPFMDLLTGTVGHEKHGILTAPRLIQACETNQVPLRDPNKPRAFCLSQEPKVRRLQQIINDPTMNRIRGSERVPRKDEDGRRFTLGLECD